MLKIADIILKDKTFFVSGDLNFANVMSVYEKSAPLILQSPELIFDFSQLKSSDSSGLALLAEWIKLSKSQNKSIQFMHLSESLLSVAKAASIDGMFSPDLSIAE